MEEERQPTVGRDVSIEEIYTFDQTLCDYIEIIHSEQMLRHTTSS